MLSATFLYNSFTLRKYDRKKKHALGMFTPLHKTEAHLFFVIVSQGVAG